MYDTVLHVMGNVGSDVTIREVGSGTHLTTFRLAATPRYWDRSKQQYVDGITNWLSVQCWRALAQHVHQSVKRGDPVIVVGRLRTQEWEKDGERHTRFVLEANSVGHDLARGCTTFTRLSRPTDAAPDHAQAAIAAIRELEEANPSLTAQADPFARPLAEISRP